MQGDDPWRDRRRKRLAEKRAERLILPRLNIASAPIVYEYEAKDCSRASAMGMGTPSALPGPVTKPISSSMSSRRWPNPGGSRRALSLSARTANRRAVDDDRGRATVIADREPAPVWKQCLGIRPKDPPEIRRMLDRRIEVDVVADSIGRHLTVLAAHSKASPPRLRATADRRRREADPTAARATRRTRARPAASNGFSARFAAARARSNPRRSPRCATRGSRDLSAPIATPIRGTRPNEDAERQVLNREIALGRDRHPRFESRRQSFRRARSLRAEAIPAR